MMNRKNLNTLNVGHSLLKIIEKVLEIDKKARCYGTGQPLFHSEIHLINAIKEKEGIHITGLAEYLGVTKGAVSQITIKLEKKGLIVKERDVNNQSRFLLQLTPLGETAYLNHLKFHEKLDQMLADLLINQPEDKLHFLMNFLESLEDKLEIFADISDD